MPETTPPPPLGPRSWMWWPLIGLAWLLAQLPYALQVRLGETLGRVLGVAWPSRRRVVDANLRLCFPELDEATRTALRRRNLRETGRGGVEFLRAWWGSLARLPAHSTLHGLEHLQRAHAAGRGVILLSGHFVHLELCGRLLQEMSALPLAAMYRPHSQPPLEWAVRRGRMRYAAMMFPRDALRAATRHLRGGGILWFAPDQETRRGASVFVPFFGQPAWSLTSTHQLARLSGAAVIVFQHRRSADGRGFELRLSEPLPDFPGSDERADTARVMAQIERLVRDAPAEYLWLHRRFKRQPDGGSTAYEPARGGNGAS